MIILPLLLAACSGTAGTPPRPNVFVLLVDTLRADRVSWYEPASTQPPLTPFLRTLAEHGTVFWNAYAQSSWTWPSVASLFTSRYPSQHHATEFGSSLPVGDPTMAESFKAGGYATAAFCANLSTGFGKGFDTFSILESDSRHGIKARADQINAAALAWLDQLPHEAGAPPAFLYLHYMEPHPPYTPPRTILETVASRRGQLAERMPLIERAQERMKGVAVAMAAAAHAPDTQPEHPAAQPLDDEILAGIEDLYDAEVASLDTQLAEFYAQLKSRGLLGNALVIITADHGEEFKEHNGFGHGKTLYNEVLHVPLLLITPGQTQRIDVRDVASIIDVAPTVLDYSGIPRPDLFEGRSLRNAIKRAHGSRRWFTNVRHLSGAAADPTSAYSELFAVNEPWRHDPQCHRRSIIANAHKLIARADDSTEAYDLAADPGEHTADASPAAAAADLRASLSRFAERMARSETPPPVPPLDEKARERLHALGYAQ